MYKAKHKREIQFDSEGRKIADSQLEVKFRFRKEVAPKDKRAVSRRIDALLIDDTIPKEYFFNDAVRINSMTRAYGYFKFGFDISCYIFGDYSPDQMIDVEKINNHILRGKEKD